MASALWLLLFFLVHTSAFYLPGVSPKEFKKGDKIDLKVDKLTSTKTHIPYEFYKFKFCEPNKKVSEPENLGEYLMGERIFNTPYNITVADEECKFLCKLSYSKEDIQSLVKLLDEEYRVNWIIDNLPAATRIVDSSHPERHITHYERGYLVGYVVGDKAAEKEYILNNHVRIYLQYHTDPSYKGYRIVGFQVEVMSVAHHMQGKDLLTCNPSTGVFPTYDMAPLKLNTKLKNDQKQDAIFTYDVYWEPSEVKWASRWDIYLSMNNAYSDQVHWFSIVNSLLIVVFLTGMVAMIMIRALHKDITAYNRVPTEEEREEAAEETGWKLVHADVFRSPRFPMFFAVFIGTGAQVFVMTVSTMIFAVLGFLSPANRGGLMTALLLLFVFSGSFAGYTAARFYKMFNGTEWHKCTVTTSFFFPGFIFSIFFFLNLVLWGAGSSGAIPFGSMFAILVLWFGISVPLNFLGAYFGFKKEKITHPLETAQIPRPIPDQPWYMSGKFSIAIGGVLPFGAVFVELFFILSSLWLDQYYYVFGFLFLVFIVLIATSAEIAIVLCYFQLCNEDYHWWWRSFLIAGSSAFYLFFYSLFYFAVRLDMTLFISGLLYFGYMLIISSLFFVFNGFIGFLSCFFFVRKIYSEVKID